MTSRASATPIEATRVPAATFRVIPAQAIDAETLETSQVDVLQISVPNEDQALMNISVSADLKTWVPLASSSNNPIVIHDFNFRSSARLFYRVTL